MNFELHMYLTLHHLHPLSSHLADDSRNVHHRLVGHLCQGQVYADEGTCPPHTAITVDEKRSLIGLVLRLDSLEEHKKRPSVVRDTIVWP